MVKALSRNPDSAGTDPGMLMGMIDLSTQGVKNVMRGGTLWTRRNLLVAGWMETVVHTKARRRKGKAVELYFMSWFSLVISPFPALPELKVYV